MQAISGQHIVLLKCICLRLLRRILLNIGDVLGNAPDVLQTIRSAQLAILAVPAAATGREPGSKILHVQSAVLCRSMTFLQQWYSLH